MNCLKCCGSEHIKSLKKKALHLYLEGLGFRSIGRFLGVSNVSVLNWIRDFGEKVQQLHADNQSIEMVEIDEMHTYIGSKKTTVGSGLLLIDMEKIHRFRYWQQRKRYSRKILGKDKTS